MAKAQKTRDEKPHAKEKKRTLAGYLTEWVYPHKFKNNPLCPVYLKLYLLNADLNYIHVHVEFTKAMRGQDSYKSKQNPAPTGERTRRESRNAVVLADMKNTLRVMKVLSSSILFLNSPPIQSCPLCEPVYPYQVLKHVTSAAERVLGAINREEAQLSKETSPQGKNHKAEQVNRVLMDALGLSGGKGRTKEKLITWLLGKLTEHLRTTTGKPHSKLGREIIRIVFKKSISAKAAYAREQNFRATPKIDLVGA